MKIFVDILTPANGMHYEVIMDDRSTVEAAVARIIEEITLFENGQISFDKNPILCSAVKGERLPAHRNLRLAGVESGHTLILV